VEIISKRENQVENSKIHTISHTCTDIHEVFSPSIDANWKVLALEYYLSSNGGLFLAKAILIAACWGNHQGPYST
jgi:hypothetical protein